MNRKRLVILLAALILAGGIGGFFYLRSDGAPRAIELSGNVEVDDVAVGFKLPGEVTARLLDEGDTVSKGQLIARLDASELQHQVKLQSANVEATKARLDELLAGTRSERLARHRQILEQLATEDDQKRRDFYRARELHERNVVSKSHFEHARTQYRTIQKKVEAQRETLNELVEGPRSEKIRQVRAELKSARQRLALAKKRLSYTRLRAPIEGRILADHVESGEYVQPGLPIVTIGNLREVWIRAYLEEPDLGRVKLGMPVRISIDSYPDRTFKGRLSFISDEAEFTPKTIETRKERTRLVYRVKIDVANPEGLLKPGMPAEARIDLER